MLNTMLSVRVKDSFDEETTQGEDRSPNRQEIAYP